MFVSAGTFSLVGWTRSVPRLMLFDSRSVIPWNEPNMSLNEFSEFGEARSKLLAILILGLGSIVSGLVPLYCTKHGTRPLLITVLLCFGAGVLLATALVHMLPEVRLFLPRYAEVIFCVGYFLIYAIDELVCLCTDAGPKEASSTSERVSCCYENSLVMLCKSDASNRNLAEVEVQPVPVDPDGKNIPQQSVTGTFSLLLALCVHSLLEGLAIGVQNSASKVMLLLGAVSAHKFVVAFCLGVEISSHRDQRHSWKVAQIVIFSLGSVIGIAVGMALDGLDDNFNKFVIPILQGVAGGTLLYVTVSEVLPREREKRQREVRKAGILQLLAVLGGFAVMSALSLIITET
ncbi:zinc transporter ZIP1-like [Malaya genurostris]|uniref:zinc transporter ZIP1-like n=1 Tax=Malaya genurostris TaxID=325434 RepID=UPI0026F3CC24|nr:zinc transporter ZIP1-like [Malaya genurostris]